VLHSWRSRWDFLSLRKWAMKNERYVSCAIHELPCDKIKFFTHGTKKYSFDIYIYSLISLLHVSASLMPSSRNLIKYNKLQS
jgi:hypothetical protein